MFLFHLYSPITPIYTQPTDTETRSHQGLAARHFEGGSTFLRAIWKQVTIELTYVTVSLGGIPLKVLVVPILSFSKALEYILPKHVNFRDCTWWLLSDDTENDLSDVFCGDFDSWV